MVHHVTALQRFSPWNAGEQQPSHWKSAHLWNIFKHIKYYHHTEDIASVHEYYHEQIIDDILVAFLWFKLFTLFAWIQHVAGWYITLERCFPPPILLAQPRVAFPTKSPLNKQGHSIPPCLQIEFLWVSCKSQFPELHGIWTDALCMSNPLEGLSQKTYWSCPT